MTQTLEPSRDWQKKVDISDHYVWRIENSKVGLGKDAVKATLDRADNNTDPYGSPSLEQGYIYVINDELSMARERLSQLNESQRQAFNDYLAAVPGSKWLDWQLGFDDDKQNKDYVGALTKHNKFEYAVPDKVFLNFLEWHNFHLNQNQEKFRETLKKYKVLFGEKLQKYTKKGVIPEWVSDAAEQKITNVVVAMDDGFTTAYGENNWDGSTTFGYTIRAHSGKEEAVLQWADEHASIHEFVHVIDGHDGQNRGLMRLLEDHSAQQVAGVVLNEAVVEHLAHTLYKENDVDDTDPLSPARQGAAYFDYRNLLNILCTMGEKRIDIRDFIAAHFDDGNHLRSDGKSHLEHLKSEIEEAYPDRDILFMLSRCEDEKEISTFCNWLRMYAPNGGPTPTEKLYARQDRAEKITNSTTYKVLLGSLLAAGVFSAGFLADEAIHYVNDNSTPAAPAETPTSENNSSDYAGVPNSDPSNPGSCHTMQWSGGTKISDNSQTRSSAGRR